MGYINVKSDRLYSNISNEYNPQTKYAVGNYCYYDGTIKKCTSAVADYSKTAAYAIGDYCYHEDSGTNNLYKCNTAIPDPGEEWTASHWTLTTELPTGKWVSVVVTDELGGGGSVDLTCVAPAYEETTEYHANDIVLHGGKVYYCKGDSATGPWTPSEWIECPISKLLIYDAIAPIWSTQYEYQSGQWTTYRGHLYICAVETSTQGEFKDDEWYKISIDKTLHSMVHAIIDWTAPWFNETIPYEKHALVMHLADPVDLSSARLYRAKYNLTAGAWQEDDWEPTTIAEVKNDLAYQKSITRETWAADKVYRYGDVVMYNGKLCKAVVDAPTAGEFKNDEWDLTDTFTELNLTVGKPYVVGAGVTYNAGDIVQANGGLYQALDTAYDTDPFKPETITEATADLTAIQIAPSYYGMSLTTEQVEVITNKCVAKGYADIKYIGTVASVDINETVRCAYSTAPMPVLVGTLSNGWTLFAQAMNPTAWILGISTGTSSPIIEGDTANITVSSSDVLWKQVYVEHTPINHDVIAATFQPTESYTTGNFVMYGNELYKAKEDISAGAWDPTKWEATAVTAELGTGGLEKGIIASDFDETKTYEAGAVVFNGNELYMANEHLDPGPWDSSKWKKMAITDEWISKVARPYIQNEGRTYHKGDLVQHGGRLYKCIGEEIQDTSPFGLKAIKSGTSTPTAGTIGSIAAYPCDATQYEIWGRYGISAGAVDITFNGSVGGTAVNETVHCTYNSSWGFQGDLSIGKKLSLYLPNTGWVFVGENPGSSEIVAGETAEITVAVGIDAWTETIIDREPHATFVIKNNHDLKCFLENDTSEGQDYTIVEVKAMDLSYYGGFSATRPECKEFIGNNYRMNFYLSGTVYSNIFNAITLREVNLFIYLRGDITYGGTDNKLTFFSCDDDSTCYNKVIENCNITITNYSLVSSVTISNTASLYCFDYVQNVNICNNRIYLNLSKISSSSSINEYCGFIGGIESNTLFTLSTSISNNGIYINFPVYSATSRPNINTCFRYCNVHDNRVEYHGGATNVYIADFKVINNTISIDAKYSLNVYCIYGRKTNSDNNIIILNGTEATNIIGCSCIEIGGSVSDRNAIATNNKFYNRSSISGNTFSNYIENISRHYGNYAYDRYYYEGESTGVSIEVWNDDIKANDVSIAAEFVAGGTYTVGQFVMYKNDLYKCNTAGTYASWDATKFTQTKVTDELGGGGGAVTSVNGLTGAVVLDGNNVMVDSTAANTPVAIKTALETKSNDVAIAEEFSTTKGYTVDDLVMHNNNLYKAKYTRSARDWSDANWTQVKVADYLKSTGIVWDPVAEAYDSSTQYHSGDIVAYDNKMYRNINSCIGTFSPGDWVQTTAAKIACAPYTYVIRTDEDLACFMNCNIKSGETASEKFKNVGFSLEQQTTFTYYGDIANFGSVFSSGNKCYIWGNGATIDVTYSPDYDTSNQWNYVFDFCEFHDATIKTTLGNNHEKDADFALFANCGFHNCTVNIPDNMYLEWRINVPNRNVRVVYNGTASEDTKFILPVQDLPDIKNINFFNFAGVVKNCYFDIQGWAQSKITIVGINAVSGFYNNRITGTLNLGVDSSVTSDCTLLNMNNGSEVMSDNDIRFEFTGGNLVNVVNCNGCAKNNYIFVKLEDIIVAYGLIATNYYKDCSGNSIYFENTSCCKVYGIMTSGSLVHDNFIYMSPGSTSTYSSTYVCYGIYCQTSTPRTVKGNTIQFITCTNFNFYGIFAIESTTIDGNNILATNGPDEDCNTFRGIYCSNGGCYIMNNTIDARLHDGVGGAISYIHCMNYGRYKIIDNTIIHGCSNSDHTIVHTSIIIKAIQVATNIGSIVQQNRIFNRIDNVQGNVEATWKINNVFDVATGIDTTNNLYYDET